MSETDQAHAPLEDFHPPEKRRFSGPEIDRRSFLRRTALTGAAAGSVGAILSACGSSASSSSSGSSSVFGSHPSYKFVFVNHVTTNSFFVPTQYGIQDACKLLGCTYQWTGSENSNVGQMVTAMNTAITSGADGIAVALIDNRAFNKPTEEALAKGIPVIAYNADAPTNKRLSYVGQELKLAGELMGARIVKDVGSGDIMVAIATPGSANLQPRLEGIEKAIKASGAPITVHTVATGAAESGEENAINAYWVGHETTKGLYAVDGGSTASTGKVMQKHGLSGKGVKAGGFDLTEASQKLVKEGNLEFLIDQQPYQQGFLPTLQLFLWHVSGSTSGPATTDTGLKFVTKESVAPYIETKSRYQGTSTEAKVVPVPAGTPA